MPANDARSASRDAQVELRRRAVEAVSNNGVTQLDAAKALGVHHMSVYKWVKRFKEVGAACFTPRPKGPEKGSASLLTAKQAQQIRNLIVDKCPEQLKLPIALWTRDAVRDLIKTRLGITVAIRTVGDYLREWGFTPQKPVRRAYEKSSDAVQEWLQNEYPSIANRAKQEKALIYWGDEMGLRSDHAVGRSYGFKGQTPVIPATGKRFSCSMISAITNQGHLSFRVYTGTFTAKLLIDFFRRLISQAKRKVFLILDGHPVHRAKVVKSWVAAHTREIEVFYLPSYSPELNPDELLNQDVKSNVARHDRPRDLQTTLANLRCYLFSTQKRPDIVM